MKEEYYGVKRPIDMALRNGPQNVVPDLSVLILKICRGVPSVGAPFSKRGAATECRPYNKLRHHLPD